MTTTAPRTQMICNSVLIEKTLLKSVTRSSRVLAPMTQLNSKLERLLSQRSFSTLRKLCNLCDRRLRLRVCPQLFDIRFGIFAAHRLLRLGRLFIRFFCQLLFPGFVSELTSTNALRRNRHQTCGKRCGAAIVLSVSNVRRSAVTMPSCCFPRIQCYGKYPRCLSAHRALAASSLKDPLKILPPSHLLTSSVWPNSRLIMRPQPSSIRGRAGRDT
jgi:hypothetical protein